MKNAGSAPLQPPAWANRFLRSFCKSHLLEEIEGDLFEFYERTHKARGRRMAAFYYWYHVLHFFRPFALKSFYSNSNKRTMLRFNLIIAFRNLNKYRFYSMLNISGLAIGLATCIFITLFVLDELSYDKFHPDHERIYRVASDLKFNDNEFNFPVSPAPMAEAFPKDFPEIEEAGKMRRYGTALIKKGDVYYKQNEVYFATQGLLDVFRFPVVYGNLENAISQPNTIVLSQSAARKMFGDTDPVGETVELDDWLPVKIAAVYEDLPQNSHFHPQVLISIEHDRQDNGVWLSNNYYTYFKLNEDNDEAGLEGKFETVYERYFGPQVQDMVGVSFADLIAGGSRVNYYLQPVGDIHLKSDLAIEIEANGSMDYVYIFGAIAAFILIIACINFMNLSTARAAVRAKEVGMRKVLGSVRGQLIGQFLTESVLFAFLAGLIALVVVVVLLPYFNNFTGKQVGYLLWDNLAVWGYLLLAILLIGVMAGLYPAFYLSRYQPTQVLKGSYLAGQKASWFRNILVVFQFATSLFLIVGSFTVYSQLKYTQTRDLGFDKEQVVVLSNVANLRGKGQVLKQELLKNPAIEHASASYFYPLSDSRADSPFMPKEGGTLESSVTCQTWSVDFDYVKTFDMTIVQGRDFDRNMPSDSTGILINETAAKRFGLENPIGQQIKIVGDFFIEGRQEWTILGVVKDFHFESLRNGVVPVLLYISKNSADYMALRVQSPNLSQTMAEVEEAWKQVSPNIPFEYHFLDQSFEAKYRAENQLGAIFTIFSGLAVFIGCLGLFGLSAYTAERRKKELGIRKVLGASVFGLVRLLFSEFSVLLLVSIAVAVPLAWLAMEAWLSDFAYRMQLGAGSFVLASLMVVLIGLLTVSIQSLKAAKSNPVNNLKYE